MQLYVRVTRDAHCKGMLRAKTARESAHSVIVIPPPLYHTDIGISSRTWLALVLSVCSGSTSATNPVR